MPSLAFESLPSYSWPGGSISGTVVLQVDAPTRGRNLWIELSGRELAQVTVSQGKGSNKITEEAVFFQQTWDPGPVLTFADPVHIAPGVYRAPFQFSLPATAQPSIHTTPYVGSGGVFDYRRDGLYVEYALEARLKVPMWPDVVARALIPIFSSRRVLGILPPCASPPDRDHPTLALGTPGTAPLLPGGTLRVPFQIENPGGKRLRSLRLALTRVVQYRARGVPGIARSPTYQVEQPLGGNAPTYAGTLEISVPNTEDATGPGQGRLYVTFWTAKAVLDVELGFNVDLETALFPG
ncbi:MAG: hypothetical protein L3J93_01580 [Thermoplasmata archaeon]|nr:hypothetical protein [Thermoplasmata archaeon]